MEPQINSFLNVQMQVTQFLSTCSHFFECLQQIPVNRVNPSVFNNKEVSHVVLTIKLPKNKSKIIGTHWINFDKEIKTHDFIKLKPGITKQINSASDLDESAKYEILLIEIAFKSRIGKF